MRIPILVAWRVGFWICFQPSQQASPKKGCLGWWLQSVWFLKYTKLVCRFLQHTNKKRNQWKMLGVLKNAKLFLKVVWHVIGWHRLLGDQPISFHQLLYFPYSVSNRKYYRFFLKQTEHLPPVWWWIAFHHVQSTIQAFDLRIKQISTHTDRPKWKKASHFKKVTWCRKFWCFFVFLLMLKLKCDVSCSNLYSLVIYVGLKVRSATDNMKRTATSPHVIPARRRRLQVL